MLDNGSIAFAKFQHFCCLEFHDLDFNSDTETIILCDRNLNNVVHALFSFYFSYSTACILNFSRIIIQWEASRHMWPYTFRDHIPNMTEMIQPPWLIKKRKGSNKLIWTEEGIEGFHFCRIAVSNCQDLNFLEDTAIPNLQTEDTAIAIWPVIHCVR